MHVIKKIKGYSFSSSETYHVFSDGLFHSENKTLGLGAIVKNESQENIMFYSEQVPLLKLTQYINHNSFEILAATEIINQCVEQGILRIKLFSDSTEVVQFVEKYLNQKRRNLQPHYSSEEKNNFILALKRLKFISAKYIPRESNLEADSFSRNTSQHNSPLHRLFTHDLENIKTHTFCSQIAPDNGPITMYFDKYIKQRITRREHAKKTQSI